MPYGVPLGEVEPKVAMRSVWVVIKHGAAKSGLVTRGAVASSSESSHASLAQSIAAPGRAGTSHITRLGPATWIRLHRVAPYGVTAIATSRSSVVGSACAAGRTIAPS